MAAADTHYNEGQRQQDQQQQQHDQLAILICSANIGNAEPTRESFDAWIPNDGECCVRIGSGSGGGDDDDDERRVLHCCTSQEDRASQTKQSIISSHESWQPPAILQRFTARHWLHEMRRNLSMTSRYRIL